MIAIIAVLAAILIPVVSEVRDSSITTKALNNSRQVGFANLLYSQENDGEILGQGGSGNAGWQDTMNLFDNLTIYLANHSDVNDDLKINTLELFNDPNVPDNLLNYGKYPYTWSINSIFNVRTGRSAEGKAPWLGEGRGGVNPRRIVEFDNPADTIYAVSGGYQFSLDKAQDEQLLQTPNSRQAIFYLHGSDDSTPAVFLDGHT